MVRLTPEDPVHWLVSRPPVAARTSETLREVAETLAWEQIGVAVVMAASRKPVGLVSERDLVRAIAEGGDPDEQRVGAVMSEEVVAVPAATPISVVAREMLARRIRHLVVLRGGLAMGVVSLLDVVSVLAQAHECTAGTG